MEEKLKIRSTTETGASDLATENQLLRAHLQEVRETLDAIRRGEVDGLVAYTSEGEKVYSLSGADRPYRAVVEEMRQGAVMLAEDNVVIYCNKGFAKTLNSAIEKIIGVNIQKHVLPGDRRTLLDLLSLARAGGGSITKEVSLLSSDGSSVPTLISATSAKVNDLTSTFLVITDLTEHMEEEIKIYTKSLEAIVKERTEELNRSNQELRMRETMQRDFINTAAHELRTPIQPLLVVTELLEDTMNETNADSVTIQRSEVEMLARNAKRLENLTKRILDVSRLENGRISLRKQNFDLNRLVEDVIEDLSQNAGAEFVPSSSGLEIFGDRTRIAEVCSNLLENALKYSKVNADTQKVVVSTWKQEQNACFQIKDRGPGIDDESIPKLFTKFFTKSDSGIGLGLYISKMIIEAHSGKIWGANNTDGKGMSFYFTLPLARV